MIDFINSIPDHIRMIPQVFTFIATTADLFGLTMFEDGSVIPFAGLLFLATPIAAGDTVTFREENPMLAARFGDTDTIVVDPDSPVGAALVGHGVGDYVSAIAPAGLRLMVVESVVPVCPDCGGSGVVEEEDGDGWARLDFCTCAAGQEGLSDYESRMLDIAERQAEPGYFSSSSER
jgi:hypothetical protein